MRKKGNISFRLKPDEYDLIEMYVVPALRQNGNRLPRILIIVNVLSYYIRI